MSVDFVDLPQCMAARGELQLPGSKSISNRALLLAALADGNTELRNLLHCDDTERMREALMTLGVEIENLVGDRCLVRGIGRNNWINDGFPVKQAELFLGNAGTAMRSLTAVLAVVGGDYVLSGIQRMHERPIADLVDTLRQVGCNIEYLAQHGYPPLRISPPQLKAGQDLHVRGDISSQFLSGLLMALPLSSVEQNLQVTGGMISRPYVAMTLALMERFGVKAQRDKWRSFRLAADSNYVSPGVFEIEGDASTASYFLALAAVAAPNGAGILVQGVGKNSLQGDVGFANVLQEMGAQVVIGQNSISVSAPTDGLRGVTVDCKAIPDAAMTLATTALFAHGVTRLNNIASWRVKETDRITAMSTELRKLGATVEDGEDYLQISRPEKLQAATIDTYDDHRIAMSFAIASCGTPLRINEPGCVNKTCPTFFRSFARLTQTAPVIAIDGPSASGKGTVAALVARQLGWQYLDSGSFYRLVALAARQQGIDWQDEVRLASLAASLEVRFSGDEIWLGDEQSAHEVSNSIRSEDISAASSVVAAFPQVRAALVFRQRAFRATPGLVAEGRDMASAIFPSAGLKVFLTASVEARAARRHKQLLGKGVSVRIADILDDLRTRDARDAGRVVAPMQKQQEARLLDTTDLSIETAVEQVLQWQAQAVEASCTDTGGQLTWGP